MIPSVWRPHGDHRWVRLPLLVPAGMLRLVAQVRARLHTLARPEDFPRPAIVVGNLSVGGTGKTPIVGWLVSALATQGLRAGVIVHPAAADEGRWHAEHPAAPIVVADRDRRRGGRTAASRGADVLVFDDGLQQLGAGVACRLVLVAAEQEALSPWPVPAGPWRSSRTMLRQADLIVVTRKIVPDEPCRALAGRLEATFGRPATQVHLRIAGFRRLRGGPLLPPTIVRGARVAVAVGVADPWTFQAQLEALGASVRLRAFPDHHRFRPRDVAAILEDSGPTDYVVVTSKDAVKLRTHWPATPDPLVAELAVEWEGGVEPKPSAAGCRWSA